MHALEPFLASACTSVSTAACPATQFHLLAVLDDALHGLKEGVVMSSETRIVVLHCRAGKADSITGNELLAQVDVRHESFGFDLKRHIIQFSRIEGG